MSIVGSAVALLKPARPARQGAAVLGAGRRGPDHVKVAGREHGHGLPAAHVGADGGLRPGIKIQAYYLPAQLRKGPAPTQSPRTVQQSSRPRFPSRAGRRARSPQRIKRSRPAQDCTGRAPKAANAAGHPYRRTARAAPESCRAAPHLGRTSLFGSAADRAMELTGRGADQLPRRQVLPLKATLCGAPPRACRCHVEALSQGSGWGQGQRPPRGHGGSPCWRWAAGKALRPSRRPPCSAAGAIQSCLKTSAQGVKFGKLKATLAYVRFWDARASTPMRLIAGRRILLRKLWVMNQQCGLLLELRDVKLDERAWKSAR